MQNLVEDKFDLRSHGSNDVFFVGDHTIFFKGEQKGISHRKRLHSLSHR